MVKTIASIALATLLLSAPALAQEPSAEDIAKARPLYKRGLELYSDGAFDAALVELQKAHALAPSYRILYNIALVNGQLNDFAAALQAYRGFLEEGGKKVDAKRRAEVEREIKRLEGRVAEVTLRVNVDGAEVLVDDAVVGTSPLPGPLLVNSGKRKLTATKSGYTPTTRVLIVGGGDATELELELRDPQARASAGSAPATTPVSSPPPEVAEPPAAPIPWLWWGVTGALAATTTTFGLLTLSAQSDLDAERENPSTKARLDDRASKTRTLAVITDVTLVGTLAVGGYALYRTLNPSAPEKLQGHVDVRVGPGSVFVGGSF